MLYFKDEFSQQQFKLWMNRALSAQDAKQKCQQAITALLLLDKKEEARACRDELTSYEWADKFMNQVHRWMVDPTDQSQVVLLYADKNDMEDGLTKEFGVCVYNRPASYCGLLPTVEEVQQMANDRKGTFMYNGGWINHGDCVNPSWTMHT